ncbi:MAG: EamA family transporter [Carboxydocellales bacterium]
MVEASLGYYINPLINVSLGVLVLRERLNFWQLVALFLAAIGVIILASQFGKIPWLPFLWP